MISVFDFNDYKLYLSALERERTHLQRGFRSRLAEVLGCQNAYISQVLNTHANFSLEQAFKISKFLNHTKSEFKYFIILVEVARAGTEELKAYFQKELSDLRERHLNIKERVGEANTLSSENQAIYYSSWIYAAIHMLLTIPKFSSAGQIVEALNLPLEVVQEALIFLSTTGLVVEKNGALTPGAMQIHLDKNSPHIRQHHMNWRISAIQSLSRSHPTKDLHYSTVSSLSAEDAERLKTKLVTVIQDYVETVRPSKEEVIFNFNLDFYSLIKK